MSLFAQRRPTNVRRRPPGVRGAADRPWWQRWLQRNETDDDEGAGSGSLVGRAGVVVAALLCLGLLAYAVANLDQYTARTQQFHVARFEVRGNQRVTNDAVIAASGVQPGSSLMAVDAVAAQRNVEKLPWVRRAKVAQVLPSTLAVEVVEYEPAALILAERLLLVDRSGYVFKPADRGEARELPVITGLKADLVRDASNVANTVTPTRRRLQELLRVIELHATSPIAQRFPLSELHWDAALGLTLVSARDGAEVRLGKAAQGDLARAFALVQRLLDRVQERGEWLRYALVDDDLRSDRAVVYATPLPDAGPLAAVAKPGGAAAVGLPKAGTQTSKNDAND
jgi:hypothetical protein